MQFCIALVTCHPLEDEPYTLLSQGYSFFYAPSNGTAILILDSDGNRIQGKYYSPPHLSTTSTTNQLQYITTPQPNPYPTVKDQKAFEKSLSGKTKKQSSDVILYDNKLCVYKQGGDVTLYVIGGAEENEIMLYLVVVALRDCLDALLKYRSSFLYVDLVIPLIRGRLLRIMILSRCVLMRFVMMGEPFQYVLC